MTPHVAQSGLEFAIQMLGLEVCDTTHHFKYHLLNNRVIALVIGFFICKMGMIFPPSMYFQIDIFGRFSEIMAIEHIYPAQKSDFVRK
jgi:hypothetical protein